VAGTRIATVDGLVAVEALRPGDLVLTRDEGAQPLRWIGRRRVAAQGAMAPIAFAAGALGAHGALRLSPEHRVMLQDGMAEMLFGTSEILVAAKHLVNDRTIRRQTGGEVDYVHLLFDRHQVIMAEGLASESLFLGGQALGALAEGAVAEILAIFPELDAQSGEGYGPTARRVLKAHEAQVMMRVMMVNAAA
jgi:hypothetical protein